MKMLVLNNVERAVSVSVLELDEELEELRVQVVVKTPEEIEIIAPVIWVSFFDFPMVDNLRLNRDQRIAVVLENLDLEEMSATLRVLVFPGAYAALKEMPWYQEILERLHMRSEGWHFRELFGLGLINAQSF